MVILGKLREDERISTVDLARQAGVPDAFLAKLLRQLGKHDLLDGQKGHHGGYRLARPPQNIPLMMVLHGLEEGDMPAPTECAMGVRPCNPQKPCLLHHRWSAAIQPMLDMLNTMTVADLALNRACDPSD